MRNEKMSAWELSDIMVLVVWTVAAMVMAIVVFLGQPSWTHGEASEPVTEYAHHIIGQDFEIRATRVDRPWTNVETGEVYYLSLQVNFTQDGNGWFTHSSASTASLPYIVEALQNGTFWNN